MNTLFSDIYNGLSCFIGYPLDTWSLYVLSGRYVLSGFYHNTFDSRSNDGFCESLFIISHLSILVSC